VIVIGNNAGLQTYFSQEASSSLALAILQAGKDSKTNTPCNWIQQPFNEIVPHTAPRTIHLSGKFKKAAHLVSVDQLLAELKTRPNKPYEPLQKAIPDLKPVSNRHLKWGNTTIHYTDGSAKDGLAGAGVVVSAAPMTANHRTKIPLGRGSSLMAELAGIYHALNSYDRNSPIHVASDCLTAITAIRNGIRDPTTIPSHKEETILRKCISAVKTRPAKTTILKVKAHIGIWGNTEADLAANDGRRLNTTETVEITDLTHSEKIFVSSRTEAAPIKPTEIHEIMKLNTASRLADIEYAKCNSASALNSNTTSSIAFKWSDATISGDILAPSDYGFDKVRLEKTSFRAYCRGKVMQQDRRHGKLCKLPGCNKIIRSPFHACGGCDNPLQKGKIQDEANKLTHKIAKAVQRGTLGKYTLLINAGTKHAVSGKEDATIPTWMLPGTYGCRNFPDKIDIVLIEGWVSGDPQPTPQSDVVLTIVEATSCHDYHIPNTVNHKRSKYVELVIALQQEGWTVKLSGIPPDQWDSWYRKYNFVSSSTYKDLTPSTTSTIPSPIHTIVIGHCGTHSPSNIAALLALGINKNSIHTVLRELSTQAVYRLGACQASYNKLERSPD
jgi:ribonuclease HI